MPVAEMLREKFQAQSPKLKGSSEGPRTRRDAAGHPLWVSSSPPWLRLLCAALKLCKICARRENFSRSAAVCAEHQPHGWWTQGTPRIPRGGGRRGFGAAAAGSRRAQPRFVGCDFAAHWSSRLRGPFDFHPLTSRIGVSGRQPRRASVRGWKGAMRFRFSVRRPGHPARVPGRACRRRGASPTPCVGVPAGAGISPRPAGWRASFGGALWRRKLSRPAP